MNIPMSWIKQYVDIDCDIQTYTDAMTMSGSKVETYEETGAEITKVVSGKIIELEKHPDADKLVVTKIDIAKEQPLQIVTGAKNVSVGDIIPVALHGATLAEGLKIKKGKLRGVVSEGMMCSVEELGFCEEDIADAPHDGVYIFPEDMKLGIDVKPYFGLGEKVVEYEITSNRPDCFSILGIAREAAATFKKEFRFPEIEVRQAGGNVSEMAQVAIENSELCPRYMARVVKNVKVKESPKWLKDRLVSAGVRPINNIVDITNYIMLEMGQPMHAFDYDKLEDHKIIVRNAKEGETIKTLDGEEHTLDSSMLVIADPKKPLAVAGVMGGETSKVTEDTTTILFESANFKGSNIRITSKKLGLRSDSSVKFTKGLDPNNAEIALERAAQLIEQLGAEVVSGKIDVYPNKREPKTISYNAKDINSYLGTQISEEEMIKYFKRLEFIVDESNKKVTIPTFRPDVTMMADLAEEVARMYGYDKIEPTLETGTPTVGKKTYEQQIQEIIYQTMSMQGIHEAMTYTFESPKVFDKLCVPEGSELRKAVKISNPLGEDFSVMRTSTLSGMLTALSTNYNRRNETALLYEIGKVFSPKQLPMTELPEERMKLTIGMYGEKIDFFDLKGAVETVFERLGMSDKVAYIRSDEMPSMHPGRTAYVMVGDKKVATIGEIHPQVAKNYDIGTKAYIAVIDMPQIIEYANLDSEYKALPKFPAMTRDIAMLAKDEVLAGDIERIIKQRGGKLLESYQLFDVYKGKQIEEGYKSIAYNITFRALDRTLTEDEVNKTMKKILNGLETQLQAKLR